MSTINAVPQHAGSGPEVASMVHDLRNPLTAIHGGAELLVGSRLSQLQIHRAAFQEPLSQSTSRESCEYL